MALYKVTIKSSAGKELASINSKADRIRIVARIHALAAAPRPRGAEKLGGFTDRYRIRQGHYRIVYLVDDEHDEVTIYKIGNRKNVYQ